MTHPARAAGLKLLRPHALIAGEAVTADARIAVDDPATGEVIGHVPDLGAAETDRAIAAAHEAFPAWSRTSPHERAAFLRRWAALIDANAEGLAGLMALENGKPLEEARGEVAYANGFLKWFAGEAERIQGETQDSPLGHAIVTFREAVGPCAFITPWNFPLAIFTGQIAAALAAGNPVLAKPAEQTPASILELMKVIGDLLPPGVDSNGWADVFVRDLQGGGTVRVNLGTAGAQANQHSDASRISANGTHVIYATVASNLVAGDTNAVRDIFVSTLRGAA